MKTGTVRGKQGHTVTLHSSKDLKDVRKSMQQLPQEGMVQAEGPASSKTLGTENAWQGRAIARHPAYLEGISKERAIGGEVREVLGTPDYIGHCKGFGYSMRENGEPWLGLQP